MLDINLNTKNFINYYCSLDVEPEYALMVKGPWGCGKSHLVKDCIDTFKGSSREAKFLYVSLYGISEISDIEAKFFEQLNPVLSNKKVMFAGQIAKGVLKGALKIDLDGDNKPDAQVSVGVPDINLADYLTDTRNCILVFDDLERCELDLQLILGYINYFVEKEGYKVLIIADEEKIINQDSSREEHYKYTDIKEKLIGKTVKVEPDVSLVFDNFVNNLFPSSNYKDMISNDIIKQVLAKHKERIIHVFQQSGHENLRSLRKCVLDLKQFLGIFDNSIIEEDKLIEHFCSLFIAFSMEIHSGNITPENLNYLTDMQVRLHLNVTATKNKESAPYSDILKKYDVEFKDTLIEITDWQTFFSSGSINKESILSSLKKTKYFSQSDTPKWVRLWYLYELADSEFIELKSSVENSFINREYNDLGVLKHVAGMFLVHSSLGLSQKPSDNIVNEVESYLSDITDSAQVDMDTHKQINLFGSYASLGFHSSGMQEFQKISDVINKFIAKKQEINLRAEAENFLSIMTDDPSSISNLFYNNEQDNAFFYRQPILQCIEPKEFVEKLLKMPNKDMNKLLQIITDRLEGVNSFNDLYSEVEWLSFVIEELYSHLKSASSSISRIILESNHQALCWILAFDEMNKKDERAAND